MQLSDKMMMAVIILTLSYVLLFTEKLNRAVVAILGVPVRFTGDNFRQETAKRKMESMKKLITD